MNLLLDTNILLAIFRAKDAHNILTYINPQKALMYTSVVVEAEVKSLATRNKWNKIRLAKLDSFLEQFRILEVSQTLVQTYVEIDSYSQRQHPHFTTYPFDTPRNMGKNDLWIASTAALLNLELVTTDLDFNHLDNVFLDRHWIDPANFKPYFRQ